MTRNPDDMSDIEQQEKLLASISAGQLDEVSRQLSQIHPSEIADLLESLPAKDRELVWDQVGPELEGDVLSHAQESVKIGLLGQMQPEEVAQVTRGLEADDVADILNALPDDIADSVLLSMDTQNRERLTSVLSYPEDTAGGLMNLDVVSVRANVTLDVVARYLRKKGTIPNQTDRLMVVDRENTCLGVLPLADILTKKPKATVGEVLVSEFMIAADTSAREVAKIFEQRDLFSAAVVDTEGKLLGRITVDDVVDVIQEQAEATVLNMAGLSDEDIFAPVLTSAKRRAVWLGINLLTALLASWVIGRFEETIQELVALAILMPIVASMGGIAGSQTLTLSIRGLAVGQINKRNARSLMNKELAVGIFNGAIWACVVGTVSIFWFNSYPLGIIIGLAMLVNLSVAALAGSMIPIILNRLGVDPAIAGSVLLTTVTDVVGFMTFLGLAALYLGN